MSKSTFPIAERRTSFGRVLLVASLGLNLAIIGVIAGASFRKEHVINQSARNIRAQAMQERDFGLGPFVGALDGDARRAVGEAFLSQVGSREAARETVRLRMQDTVALLKAEPFDADAFEMHFTLQQKFFAERQDIGKDALIKYVSKMSSTERAEYTQRLGDILDRPRGARRSVDAEGTRGDGRPVDHQHPPNRRQAIKSPG